MNLDGLLSTFSPEVRESASMKGLVILIQTLLEQLHTTQQQLQATQEQLTKAQDISLIPKEIVYKLEVWQSPNGNVIRGKIPEDLKGQHFGSTLRAFTTNLYAQGMTQPAIHEFLRNYKMACFSAY